MLQLKKPIEQRNCTPGIFFILSKDGVENGGCFSWKLKISNNFRRELKLLLAVLGRNTEMSVILLLVCSPTKIGCEIIGSGRDTGNTYFYVLSWP